MQAEIDSLVQGLLQGCSGLSILKGQPAAPRHHNIVLGPLSAVQILQCGGTLP